MRIDLHTHSTASDGLLSPARLVVTAREHGVGTLALTDHDTTAGVEEAVREGRRVHVDVIPGVEINTDVDEYEIHVLGYYIDLGHRDFQNFLARMRAGRVGRARAMVEKLAALRVPVEWARVQAIAAGASVGRPHVARALVEARRVATVQEAFERFLGRDGPAYVPRLKVAPEEAVEAIRAAEGVPVLAHPGWTSSGPAIERVPRLVAHGLAGIEVYYPDHTAEMTAAFLEVAQRYHLIVTGGTDFHGGALATRVPPGSVAVPADVLAALRARWSGSHGRPGPAVQHIGGCS
ncbi:MAG TPA: PHP domain-containing protein [bacterium]|nr:PHP domain-containing protein [bacterium]